MRERRTRPRAKHLRSLGDFQTLYGVKPARQSIHNQSVALVLVGPDRHHVIVLEVIAGEGLTAYRAWIQRVQASLQSVEALPLSWHRCRELPCVSALL